MTTPVCPLTDMTDPGPTIWIQATGVEYVPFRNHTPLLFTSESPETLAMSPCWAVVSVVRLALEVTSPTYSPMARDGIMESDSLPFPAITGTSPGAVPTFLAAAVPSVGLLNMSASPSVAFQSALTLTSAPGAIPASFTFSADV